MSDKSFHPDDELLSEEEELERRSAAARLFDVRRVIGGLFVVYGLIVTLASFFDSKADIDKAEGVRINLWMGLAMLVFGALMLIWQRLNPPEVPSAAADDDDRPPMH